MWWIGPMWPKCAFGDKKGLIRKKDMPFGNPPYHGTKKMRTFKKHHFYFFTLYGSKSGILGQKRQQSQDRLGPISPPISHLLPATSRPISLPISNLLPISLPIAHHLPVPIPFAIPFWIPLSIHPW